MRGRPERGVVMFMAAYVGGAWQALDQGNESTLGLASSMVMASPAPGERQDTCTPHPGFACTDVVSVGEPSRALTFLTPTRWSRRCAPG